MAESPLERRTDFAVEPIAVDSAGQAYDEYTRQKESIIVSERLDARHPVVRIDLETILTEPDGCGISIIVQDFGLPPRTINISGDFVTMADVRGQGRTDQHYVGAPKHLRLSAPNPDHGKTYSLDDKRLPISWELVGMNRGQAMMFVHDGQPSDERNGYIRDNYYGLVALVPDQYYGAKDFGDANQVAPWDYVPFIGLSYEGSVLSIYSLDDVHAEVQYQQVRSLADLVAQTLETEVDEYDIDQLLANIIAGDESAMTNFRELMKDQQTARATIADLRSELQAAHLDVDALETVLGGVKRKLADARYEATRLSGEVQRLKRQAQTTPGQEEQPVSDLLRDLLGGKHTTEKDPHGHCATLGIDPDYLRKLNPKAAIRYVKGVQKGLSFEFHRDTDIGSEDDEPMKLVNIAADAVITWIENGYWGRR